MSSEEEKYVIKRVKKVVKHGHHGGAWKIAYADFVTAMMTFFLLMWLLSLLNKYQLAGISQYFRKPLKAAFVHEGSRQNTEKEMGKEKSKPEKADAKPEQAVAKPNKPANSTSGKKTDKSSQGKQENSQVKPLDKNSMMVLKGQLENKLQTDPELQQFKNQLNFSVTADGLKIELRDLQNQPMFTSGKADFESYANTILSWLSKTMNIYPNQVMIIGHTDTEQYQGASNYTNWELSADRANATRRALIKYGMKPEKIVRIVGVGDTDLLNKEDGLDPANRRIEIIILSNDAMKKLLH